MTPVPGRTPPHRWIIGALMVAALAAAALAAPSYASTTFAAPRYTSTTLAAPGFEATPLAAPDAAIVGRGASGPASIVSGAGDAAAIQDAPAARQFAPPTPAAIAAAEALRIYLVTMGPGDQVWERFGHNAIRVVDEARGVDVVYNYGMFDFAAEDFYPRFLRGDMLYWMQGFDMARTVAAYAYTNRSVYAQELNLTAEQKARLVAFLEWNAREENRYYGYDYYRDNCSTRVRDALDHALDGRLEAVLSDSATGTTYRSHTRRLTFDDLPIYTGLNVAMSAAIDRPLTAWEESFLPMRLREHVRRVRVPDESGALVPLVVSEEVLFEADRAPVAAAPPDRRLGFLLAGVLLGGIFLALGRRTARGARGARIGLAAAGGAWALVTGALGAVIALLWAFTNHYVTYGNENLLQVNPFSLGLVVLLPLALRRGAAAGSRAGRAASWLAWGVAAASVAGLLIQLLPGFDQVNGEIIALALPANVGLAAALWLAKNGSTVSPLR